MDRWVSNYTNAKLYDYAVSGAVCDNKMIYRYLSAISGPFPDVVYEVDAFVADTKYINATTKTNTLYTNRKPENTVYAMWIGTNDLGSYAFLTDSSLNQTVIPDYVDCIFDRFDTIYQNGGRNFVLMNTAPLQLSPMYGMPAAGVLFQLIIGQTRFVSSLALKVPCVSTDFKKLANITEVSGKMKEYTSLVNAIFNTALLRTHYLQTLPWCQLCHLRCPQPLD